MKSINKNNDLWTANGQKLTAAHFGCCLQITVKAQ